MEIIEEIEKMLWAASDTLEFIDNWGGSPIWRCPTSYASLSFNWITL